MTGNRRDFSAHYERVPAYQVA